MKGKKKFVAIVPRYVPIWPPFPSAALFYYNYFTNFLAHKRDNKQTVRKSQTLLENPPIDFGEGAVPSIPPFVLLLEQGFRLEDTKHNNFFSSTLYTSPEHC